MANGRLPFGTSDFEALRLDGQIYVDKTDRIYDLACERSKIFLARPRRFGKSLLVSTFETLFRDGLTWFDGLKIADRWKDTTYGVVKLDFSRIKDYSKIDAMRRAFAELLQTAFESVGFCYNASSNKSCLGQIDAWLVRQKPSSLVLLVDEYDAPLNSHLDDSTLFAEIREMLSRFFSLVKSADRVWRFIFITGIAKFNKASIFSAFNNLKDISLNPRYGTLLGYTEQEIWENFQPYVEKAAQINGMDARSLMDAMRAQYDGFCFDEEASTHVYAPWSVLSFLDEPRQGLRNFWYGSAGQASMITTYLAGRCIDKPESFACPQNTALQDLRDTNTLETLRPEIFLYQAGYLSIKERSGDDVILGYPNREVEQSMARAYVAQMVEGKTFTTIGVPDIRKVLARGNPDDAISAFNTIFCSIPYDRYPVTSESACRMAIQMLLTGAGMYSDLEKHNAFGRSDLEFDAGDFHWVLEFKYAGKNDNADTLLAEALGQTTERRYGEGVDTGNRQRLRVGLVFDGTTRQFVRYGRV